MNNQEIFDTAAIHIIKQGKPGVDKHQECKYRGEGGSMCAVGVFIPDDKYDASIEELAPRNLIENGFIINIEDDSAHFLMNELQKAHDIELVDYDGELNIVPNFGDWANTMHNLAFSYGLNTETMDNALKEAGHDVSAW